MVNRPKSIGTQGETAVVTYLKANGFGQAERRALHGSFDFGDVIGTPGICWEVKSGKAAQSLKPSLLTLWLEQTEKETLNTYSDLGILVVQRSGYGFLRVEFWWTVMPADIVCKTDSGDYVWMSLRACVRMLRKMGYGDVLAD